MSEIKASGKIDNLKDKYSDFSLILDKAYASYEKGKNILEDISFRVKKGDILGIIGGNGAGKSTILRAMTGQLDRKILHKGNVIITGINVLKNKEELINKIGYVPQL